MARFLSRLHRSRWLRPLDDIDAIDDWLGLVSPMWSLGRIRARVVAVTEETADTRTFDLVPNRRMPFRPGQHTVVELEVGGVRLRRTFSLSSAPAQERLSITARRRGHVTAAMHETLRPGSVVTLSPPAGDFVLPDPAPRRVAFLAAGVGITPFRSMLRHLAARRSAAEVTVAHLARGEDRRIFADEFQQLGVALTGLREHRFDTAANGRPPPEELAALVPRGAEVYVCGPPAWQRTLRAHPAFEPHAARMHTESFGLDLPAAPGGGFPVVAARTGRDFVGTGRPLLADAEAAGLRPAHGCRSGICQSCRVRLIAGSTVDLRTGVRTSLGGALVALCVSAAASPLVLDL